MPSTVPRPEQAASHTFVCISHSYRQGFPDGTPSADTCGKSGDVPRCDSAAGVLVRRGASCIPLSLGRRCLTTAVAPPPGHRGHCNRKEPSMVTSGMPSFPRAESRAVLHIHIERSLPQQPHPSQSHPTPPPKCGVREPHRPAEEGPVYIARMVAVVQGLGQTTCPGSTGNPNSAVTPEVLL